MCLNKILFPKFFDQAAFKKSFALYENAENCMLKNHRAAIINNVNLTPRLSVE